MAPVEVLVKDVPVEMVFLKFHLAPEHGHADRVEAVVGGALEPSLDVSVAPPQVAAHLVGTELYVGAIVRLAVHAEHILLRGVEREVHTGHLLLLRRDGVLRIVISLAGRIEAVGGRRGVKRGVIAQHGEEVVGRLDGLVKRGCARIGIGRALTLGRLDHAGKPADVLKDFPIVVKGCVDGIDGGCDGIGGGRFVHGLTGGDGSVKRRGVVVDGDALAHTARLGQHILQPQVVCGDIGDGHDSYLVLMLEEHGEGTRVACLHMVLARLRQGHLAHAHTAQTVIDEIDVTGGESRVLALPVEPIAAAVAFRGIVCRHEELAVGIVGAHRHRACVVMAVGGLEGIIVETERRGNGMVVHIKIGACEGGVAG